MSSSANEMLAYTAVVSYSGASTSAYVDRMQKEQAAIESRLLELVGIENLNMRLKHLQVNEYQDMDVIQPQEAPLSRAIGAKQRALAKFVRLFYKPRPIYCHHSDHRIVTEQHSRKDAEYEL
jgi:hypothetical protein